MELKCHSSEYLWVQPGALGSICSIECSEHCGMSTASVSGRQIWASALEAAGAGSSTSATADTGKWEPHGLHCPVVIIHLFQERSTESPQNFKRRNLDQYPKSESKPLKIMGQVADPNLFTGCSKNSMVAGACPRLLHRPVAVAGVIISTSSSTGTRGESNFTPVTSD